MIIWTSSEAEIATNGKSSNKWDGGQISIDTRTINPGDIFVALKGERQDGHDFLDLAAEKGANVAIIEKPIECKIPTLLVKDTYQALLDLANFRRNESHAKFIAVTGSVGKTTTKEMLYVAYAGIGKTFASRGNFNNKLGLSVNLASMPKDTEYAIIELGMNNKNEILELTKLVKPDIAIITNIACTHIQNFASTEEIAFAKAEIFSSMSKKSHAILNQNIDFYDILAKEATKHQLIIHNCGDDTKSKIIKIINSDNFSTVEALINDKKITYTIKTNASHIIENSLFVINSVQIIAPTKLEKALLALSNFSAIKGRGAQFKVQYKNKNITIIDDSYNASPLSMTASLNNLGKQTSRKIAIIGDMLELGSNATLYHQELCEIIINNKIDIVITCGELMHSLHQILPPTTKKLHTNNVTEIILEIDNYIENDDIILIKASNKVNLSKIFKYLSGENNVI